ncbi:secretin and TonB N-terminal domain-containing protein [Caballeronia sp. dw_19]|uniref:secretin and TonB N-terminal domain-containing protein n=1 Tax=Caballeronia sp. dw_19 TaxID=2719791 RepID=UPI001BD5E717|nr:secretin and TonB N-terminal domain-containing protein [Caballeronia sp. dw_19]
MSNERFWQQRFCAHAVSHVQRPTLALCVSAVVFSIGGCAGYSDWRDGDKLIKEGKVSEGLGKMQQASAENPEQYRMKFIAQRDREMQSIMQKATAARYDDHADEALAAYQDVLHYDPQNTEALRGVGLIAREQREKTELDEARAAIGKSDAATARQLLNAILSENPSHTQARQMLQQIDAQSTRAAMVLPALNQSLQTPVTLELKDVDIRSVLAILTQTSGISFVLDKDVSPDLRTTIYARNTTVADALNLILQTSQLDKKILNDTTVLVYPANDEKRKRYDDLVVRSYYLNSADPKKVQEMLRAVVAPKSIYVDERLKMLVVRDTESVQDTILRLIDLYDIASPEVILEVEVLEVNSNDLLNLGVQFPTSVSASLVGPAGVPASLTLDQLKGLNKNSFPLTFPDPFAVLNLRQTSGSTHTLANPRIRVLNREKASVMIGDKVPVITSTVNQNSNAITESISYLDVGLKLEVEPEIHIDNDVTMHVSLEVSNIIKEVRSSATGLLAYQIGTRNANTVLRLRDGETQVLAGLIKTDSQESGTHIPGLGKIPGLGRLFSNTNDTNARSEIVLLITPHVTRSLAVPGSYAQAFPSGTAEQVSARPLRLTPAAQYSDSDSLPAPVAPPPSSGLSAAAIASTSVVHVATDPTNPQGKTNSVRFDLAVPSQAASKTSFTVNLLANGPSFETAELDLMLDQPEIELLKVEPRTGVKVDAKQDGNRFHITIGKAAATGSLAMITFQADHPTNGPLNLSLQNLKVENENHEQLAVTVALPKQILVSP